MKQEIINFMKMDLRSRGNNPYYSNPITLACIARTIGENERTYDHVQLVMDSLETESKLYQWYKNNKEK